ncbi:dihydrolipoamide acetyltransferase family protein [Camelliibacillus cellulosilyticus]|uniref:Dihydrolipoamide acetyltransferase component of pyruvate dehydrogenase complex n=1 Tax=Camelliibacillus cellulosilyticus TaxID=2174486 RepID=A0ABV9GNI9_9BACL
MIDVKLHDIGEGMTEGEVIHLFVKEGDHVKLDEPLVEVQTDKMTAELPSPAAGRVKKILIENGDVIEVGTTMMVIDSDTADSDMKNQAATAVEPMRKKGPKRILAAPHTRKLAREMKVDLAVVTGSGPLGRITDDDVLNHKKEEAAPIAAQPSIYEEVPFNGRRKAIADKMTRSLFTIPHVTHFDEADVTELLDVKEKLKTVDGNRVSMAAFFIKALALTLQAFPIFNARLDEEKGVIRMEKAVHIGLATDTADGLIVPVIKDVQTKSIKTIHQEMKELIQKAKENRLRHQDMTGSTFTISNVGPLGSIGATPIINYPEVALMAFHKTKKMPVVDCRDQIVIRSMMNVSMSFDHRVADGAQAVAFTNKVIAYLENPYMMLIDLT